MKKLTTILAAGLVVASATAEAGNKFKNTVTVTCKASSHTLTSAVAKPAEKDIVDMVDGANVIKTSNGVIHVINSVILP